MKARSRASGIGTTLAGRSERGIDRRLATALESTIAGMALVVGLALVGFGGTIHAEPARTELEEIFQNPPDEARPWVLWHWIHGEISKEGITLDLEAMKEGGIGGAYLMAIRDVRASPGYSPAVRTLTPEWWEMLRHAFAEADRLGLKLGLHACDGFATAGGPWITPELAMQKLVWTEAVVEGGSPVKVQLLQPETNENHYRDVAVLALPLPAGWGVNTSTVVPKVTTSLPEMPEAQFLVAPEEGKQIRTTEAGWIQYAFEKPFTLRSLVIKNWPLNYGGVYHATRLRIEVSDDGVGFRPHYRLIPPRHGWQDWNEDYTFSIPEITARYFRFVHDPAGADEGAEDYNGAKWRPRLILRGLELSSAARMDNFEGKSGAVWRRPGGWGGGALPPWQLIDPGQVVDLSGRMDANGVLEWKPRGGQWLVLRFGHTPTGQHNETGGAGKGLESDKFNPAATRLQFDRWLGESIRQVGAERARRVLKYLFQDSWEAGSQNWSPVFREEFTRRRGYDPVKWLPVMAGIPLGRESVGEAENFLRDVRQTISDLMDENFFGVMAELVHAAGLEYVAETTAPTMTGDGMRHFGRVDVPMGEFWLRSPTHDKPNDIADAVSGARVYGKNIVQAEAYTQLGIRWDEHPGMLKPLADENFAKGVNRLVFHVFAHNPWTDRRPGVTLDRVGLYFQRDQTWWPEVKAWTDYIARSSALLQAGKPVVDVGYFTGEELPSRALLPSRRALALPKGFQADSINGDALRRLAEVKERKLALPGSTGYAALVFPHDGPYSDWVMKKMGEAIRGGVTVVWPAMGALETHLGRAKLEPDLWWQPEGAGADDAIVWTHRRTEDAEIYFVANRTAEATAGRLSLRAQGRAEIWDAVSGRMEREVPQRSDGPEGGRTAVQLELAPYESRFVVMRSNPIATSAKARTATGSDANKEISGPWTVSFSSEKGGPADPVTFEKLEDWTSRSEFGLKHYSGTAVYRTIFHGWPHDGSAPVWLDLGTVHNVARVMLNGVDCGVAWTPPYRVDIAKAWRAEENVLEIRITNTWANRILGDATLPESERITWTTAPASTRPEKPLPAGLLGPVKIKVGEQ